jgi:hypothetical protein
MSWNIRNCK